LYESRGGYGYITPVPAIVVAVRAKRIGIAALTTRGEWVPRWVKVEKLKERRGWMISSPSQEEK
jgi:hypothetical protein